VSVTHEDVRSRGESDNERAIVCPWCGYEDPDSVEWQPEQHGPEGDGEATCPSCEKDFECSRRVTYRYSTRRPR
jgi:hypothetical protein